MPVEPAVARSPPPPALSGYAAPRPCGGSFVAGDVRQVRTLRRLRVPGRVVGCDVHLQRDVTRQDNGTGQGGGTVARANYYKAAAELEREALHRGLLSL